MLSLTLYLLYLAEVLPWLAPLAVSTVSGAAAGFGSFRFGQGALTQRVSTVERDVAQAVTRAEFELLRDDLREIKTDLREIRRGLKG